MCFGCSKESSNRDGSFEFWLLGGQWLGGKVLDSRPKGGRFETYRHHCVVVLEQDTFILA